MAIVNLTPHTINLPAPIGEVPSSGLARCETTTQKVGEINGVPLTKTEFGEVTGLPAPEEGVIYVVSRLVLTAVADVRDDVYCPGELVRDEAGRVVGCKSLSR